jgi:hypothetical protein
MKLSVVVAALAASSAYGYSVSRSDLRQLGKKTVPTVGAQRTVTASLKMEGASLLLLLLLLSVLSCCSCCLCFLC